MPHNTTPTTSSMDVTASEREVLLLLRAEPVTDAEMIMVPRSYVMIFTEMAAALTRAQCIAQYLATQHITPE